MKIKKKHIEILGKPKNATCVHLSNTLAEVVIKRKYCILFVDKEEPRDAPPYWYVPESIAIGDESFKKFLQEKQLWEGLINSKFAHVKLLKMVLKPLIIDFLKNQPDDYLDRYSDATRSLYASPWHPSSEP